MNEAIFSEEELENALNQVWSDIDNDCANCSDPDCMGYVWLTGNDQRRFISSGVRFVRANGPKGPRFIDSYHRTEMGSLDPSIKSPSCPHRSAQGLCTIHSIRPLVCRMYPLGLEVLINDGAYWVLHTNCTHIRKRSKSTGLGDLIHSLNGILDRIDASLLADVANVFAAAAELSAPTMDTTDLVRIRPINHKSLKREIYDEQVRR